VYSSLFVNLVRLNGGSLRGYQLEFAMAEPPTLPEDLALYEKVKQLEASIESVRLQAALSKFELSNLHRELHHAREEIKRIKAPPLLIGQFLEMVDESHAICGSTTGPNYVVRVLSTIDRELLKPSATVALHKHSNALVDVLPPEADSTIQLMTAGERPDVSYQDIGLCYTYFTITTLVVFRWV